MVAEDSWRLPAWSLGAGDQTCRPREPEEGATTHSSLASCQSVEDNAGEGLQIMDRITTVNYDHLKQYMVSFNPIDKDYQLIVRWHSDLENTKESILHVCDKPQRKSTA